MAGREVPSGSIDGRFWRGRFERADDHVDGEGEQEGQPGVAGRRVVAERVPSFRRGGVGVGLALFWRHSRSIVGQSWALFRVGSVRFVAGATALGGRPATVAKQATIRPFSEPFDPTKRKINEIGLVYVRGTDYYT